MFSWSLLSMREEEEKKVFKVFIINMSTRRRQHRERKKKERNLLHGLLRRFRSITFPINLESPFGFLGGRAICCMKSTVEKKLLKWMPNNPIQRSSNRKFKMPWLDLMELTNSYCGRAAFGSRDKNSELPRGLYDFFNNCALCSCILSQPCDKGLFLVLFLEGNEKKNVKRTAQMRWLFTRNNFISKNFSF